MKKNIIIDFDSTFITGESLDWLAEIADPSVTAQLSEITKQGMEGDLSYQESLSSRLNLFSPNNNHIDQLIAKIKTSITPSILKHQNWIKNHRENIYIISGGFINYMKEPIETFGILSDHIFGNAFTFDGETVNGFDSNNPLSRSGGKAQVVSNLDLDGTIIIVGDGYTDYEIKEGGTADMFIAFTENVSRPPVVKKADQVVSSFDEVISFYES